jgi:two-component system sensor histidine kinase AtoS
VDPPAPRFRSLQAKFILATVLVLALTMAGLIGIVEHRQRAAIIEEVQRRGMALVKSLAAVSSGPLLLYNFTALEQNVVRFDAEADVAYAMVLDAEGRLAASSLDAAHVGSAPADPVSARAAAASAPLLQETTLAQTGESIYDMAVPIEVQGQKWGTARVGLSKRRMEDRIAKTRRELAVLAGLTLLAGGLAAALVARRIARPVRQLADGVAAISRGDLDQWIEAATSDEIGRLALAFNHMASELRQQRAALTAAHGELERRFAELSDLKSYTDHIFASLANGIVTFDLTGRVVTLNASAEALTGCRLEDVRGRPCDEAFPHLPELGSQLARALATGTGGAAVSATVGWPDAPPVQVELSTTPLRGAEGKDLGVLALLRDLTAVRHLEEQLRRSDRLAAIGTLAAGLAHEIKNPLTSLLTFSRHLSRRFGDERFRQRFQNVVPRELERINAIVDGLLRLSRPARLHLARVRLPELLEEVLELYGNQLEARQIAIVREYTGGLPAIDADREQLYQAVVNLVTNAIDAMPEGGTLTLRVGFGDPTDPFATPGRWLAEQRLRLEIEDTGHGIPAAQVGEVFNPFFTSKPSGTGLGLAIVHKIVEDHGGTVGLRAAPKGGTTFTVLLPIVPGRGVERTQGPAPGLEMPGRSS